MTVPALKGSVFPEGDGRLAKECPSSGRRGWNPALLPWLVRSLYISHPVHYGIQRDIYRDQWNFTKQAGMNSLLDMSITILISFSNVSFSNVLMQGISTCRKNIP